MPSTRPFASPTRDGGSEAYPPTDDGRVPGDTYLGGNATVTAQHFGTDGLLTIMHEMGHAFGLKHGHDSELQRRPRARGSTTTNSR